MNTKVTLATALLIAAAASMAGAPAFGATTHGLSCKAGTQAMQVLVKGKHVWRCEPLPHHSAMPSHGTMAPHGTPAPAPAQGTTY